MADSFVNDTGLGRIWGKIKEALAGKAPLSHTHTKNQITDFPTSMPASDVYAWAKASSKPSYGISEISGLQSALDGKEVTSNKVTSWSSTTTDAHYPSEKLVKAGLDGKANSSHTHDDRYYTESEVNNLLANKQNKIKYEEKIVKTDISTTYTIASMAVGELKMLLIDLQCAYPDDADEHKIIFPSGGTYKITGTILGYINGSGSSHTTRRIYTGGTVLTSRSGNIYFNSTPVIEGFIYRVS